MLTPYTPKGFPAWLKLWAPHRRKAGVSWSETANFWTSGDFTSRATVVSKLGVTTRGGQQQPVLRRDRFRNRLGPDPIPVPLQSHDPEDVDCHRRIQPPREFSRIARREIVTAGQNGHAGVRPCRATEDPIGHRATRVARYDDVARDDLDGFEVARDKADASGQSRPGPNQHLVQLPARRWKAFVDDERPGRCVVEDQHDLREQSVPGAEIEHPAPAKQSAHPPGDFPGFVQFLARKASRTADGAANPIEQGTTGEALEVVLRQASARGRRERHSSILSRRYNRQRGGRMPFKSQAQRRKFAQLLVEGKISNETFEEWNRETGGKKLPERAARTAAPRKKAKTKRAARKGSKRRA
jgi:hypothetical protein